MNKESSVALTFLILAAVVHYLAGEKRPAVYVGLLVLSMVAFLLPLAGLVLAIPVFVLTWMVHYKEILALWDRIKGGA